MEQFLSNEESQAASRFLMALERLLAFASENDTQLGTDELEFLIARVKAARTGFPLLQEERPAQQVDRLGSVLLGPVYTSKAHPWPLDSEGCPMAPLCQLNTAQFPVQMDGVEGLVQVWLASTGGAHGDSLIRVIPAAEVDAAEMTPVMAHDGNIEVLVPDAAAWIQDMHAEAKPSRKHFLDERAAKLGHASADELADADWDTWCRLADEYSDTFGEDVVPCLKITGFGEPRVYCNVTEDHKAALANLEKLRTKLEKKTGSAGDALVPLLTEVGQAYKDWTKVCGDQEYPCLFGTFQEIQYRALDRDTPFLCFESIGSRDCWGDGGNAQVFYSKERGFEFDWSCY
jgi:hypothetical protein